MKKEKKINEKLNSIMPGWYYEDIASMVSTRIGKIIEDVTEIVGVQKPEKLEDFDKTFYIYIKQKNILEEIILEVMKDIIIKERLKNLRL